MAKNLAKVHISGLKDKDSGWIISQNPAISYLPEVQPKHKDIEKLKINGKDIPGKY